MSKQKAQGKRCWGGYQNRTSDRQSELNSDETPLYTAQGSNNVQIDALLSKSSCACPDACMPHRCSVQAALQSPFL